MLPRGLALPHRDAFRDALPSDARPADYPARLPFVVNQAVSYAASVDLATCSWPVLPAGEHPAAPAPRAHSPGLRDIVTTVREGMRATAGIRQLDPAATIVLDDLFARVLAAAAESGWALNAAAPSPFPPAWRHATLVRSGERMEIMTLPSPTGPVVTGWCFAEAAD